MLKTNTELLYITIVKITIVKITIVKSRSRNYLLMKDELI